MQYQKDELLRVLPDYGWDEVEVYEKSKDVKWTEDWADEILMIESSWSPRGLKAYIYFLVDPMHFETRRKGENIWAIGVSDQFDAIREKPEGLYEYFPINKGHWQNSLQKVLETLDKIRQIAVNETSLV